MTVLHHLQHQPRRHREGCDQRDVDAASDHDDRHGKAEYAEHRHVLEQRQHVVGGQKAAQEDRKNEEQQREDGEDDLLLIEPKAFHPRFAFLRLRPLWVRQDDRVSMR
ncbi:hypothetical protein ACVWYI_001331 [Bradyrhizobium sp. LB13.1]